MEHWSHSRIQMFSRCPRQFWYRYILGWKIPPGSALLFGSAYHRALEENFTHKKQFGGDMPIEQVKQIFHDEWSQHRLEVDWGYETDKPGELDDRGVSLVGNYIKDISPDREPIEIEYEFEVKLPEIDSPFVGAIDLIIPGNKLVDHKTSSKRWPQSRADNELQPTAYYLSFINIFGETPREFIYDVAPKSGAPEIQVVSTVRDEEALREYIERLEIAEKAVSKEVYPKTDPTSWWCTQRWCGYYNNCMRGIPLSQLRLVPEDQLDEDLSDAL